MQESASVKDSIADAEQTARFGEEGKKRNKRGRKKAGVDVESSDNQGEDKRTRSSAGPTSRGTVSRVINGIVNQVAVMNGEGSGFVGDSAGEGYDDNDEPWAHDNQLVQSGYDESGSYLGYW